MKKSVYSLFFSLSLSSSCYRSFCPLLFPLCTFSPSQLIPFRQSNESRRTRKKGTLGMRTVMSTERREIARCNFVRLLAEATCREDYLRGKELLGRARGCAYFFFLSAIPRRVLFRIEILIVSNRILRQVSCKYHPYNIYIYLSIFSHSHLDHK